MQPRHIDHIRHIAVAAGQRHSSLSSRTHHHLLLRLRDRTQMPELQFLHILVAGKVDCILLNRRIGLRPDWAPEVGACQAQIQICQY